MSFSLTTPRAFVLGVSLLALAACSTPAAPDKMTLAANSGIPAAAGEAGFQALSVGDIQGGAGTNPLWLSNISDADFHTALETSLRNLDYLNEDSTKAAYVVSAQIVELQRPVAGFDPVLVFAPVDWAVTVKVRYTVTPRHGGVPVFDELVAATGVADGATALTSDGRVRKADEAAVRANIEAFIARMRPTLK
jgi:hypothetical protein